MQINMHQYIQAVMHFNREENGKLYFILFKKNSLKKKHETLTSLL